MTPEQLADVARLTTTVRDVLAALRVIVLAHEASPMAAPERTPVLLRTMDAVQEDVFDLANRVQHLRAREWLAAHPERPVTSHDVAHGLTVLTHGVDGRLKHERATRATSTVGRWQTGTLGKPKPRRVVTADARDPRGRE